MSAAFTSPTPWLHRNTGGTETVVDRTGQLVCILGRGFEAGNGALIVASPDLQLQLTGAVALLRETEWHSDGGSGLWCNHCKGGARGGQREPTHERGCPLAAFFTKARKALAKSEQDGGAPEDGPVETETGV